MIKQNMRSYDYNRKFSFSAVDNIFPNKNILETEESDYNGTHITHSSDSSVIFGHPFIDIMSSSSSLSSSSHSTYDTNTSSNLVRRRLIDNNSSIYTETTDTSSTGFTIHLCNDNRSENDQYSTIYPTNTTYDDEDSKTYHGSSILSNISEQDRYPSIINRSKHRRKSLTPNTSNTEFTIFLCKEDDDDDGTSIINGSKYDETCSVYTSDSDINLEYGVNKGYVTATKYNLDVTAESSPCSEYEHKTDILYAASSQQQYPYIDDGLSSSNSSNSSCSSRWRSLSRNKRKRRNGYILKDDNNNNGKQKCYRENVRIDGLVRSRNIPKFMNTYK